MEQLLSAISALVMNEPGADLMADIEFPYPCIVAGVGGEKNVASDSRSLTYDLSSSK